MRFDAKEVLCIQLESALPILTLVFALPWSFSVCESQIRGCEAAAAGLADSAVCAGNREHIWQLTTPLSLLACRCKHIHIVGPVKNIK